MLKLYAPHQELLFTHNGRWLYPLLALQDYLQQVTYPPQQLHLYDYLVGRAAALLIAHYGIKSLSTDILSQRAIPILVKYGICYSALREVAQLHCQTEELLAQEEQAAAAYKYLMPRLQNSPAPPPSS